jgi:hypothetical protein
MTNISNYLENKLLDHVFKNTAFTSPPTVYVSLHTASPGDTGASEVTGGSYQRQPTAFDTAVNGATQNSGAVTYTNMPAVTVTHFGVWDQQATGGNLLWWGDVNPDVVFAATENGIFNVGALDVSLD